MITKTIFEAKTNLSELVRKAQKGEEVIITSGRNRVPVARLEALRAGRLTSDHRDPLDRMVAAQAIAHDIPVISADPKLDSFGIRRIW